MGFVLSMELLHSQESSGSQAERSNVFGKQEDVLMRGIF